LTAKISDVIAPMMINGGAHFDAIVDAVLDQVVHHIRTASMAKLDPRITDAIEDHLAIDPMEGDGDQLGECSVEDLEVHRARKFAALSIGVAAQTYTPAECEGMVGAMLKRPKETDRYLSLRADGHAPASALAVVLHERKEDAARKAHAWNGGAL
jgi:hypothetical protein